MQIDAIVTDLDDTLLTPEAKISPYTLDVFTRAMAQGIRIIPASGRAAFSMQPFVQQMNTGSPYIASNGAQIMNADHTAMEVFTISAERARALVRYFKANQFYVQCYQGNYFYFENDLEISANYTRSTGLHGFAVGDLEAFIDFETPKLLSVQQPDQVARLYPLIQKEFPDITFTISKPIFLEAEPTGVSKGSSLQRLASRIGLTPEHTLVFGDSLNDMTMLAFAHHSVAMGNAREEVKRAARHICLTNAEDGVARFVDQHVLQSSGA